MTAQLTGLAAIRAAAKKGRTAKSRAKGGKTSLKRYGMDEFFSKK